MITLMVWIWTVSPYNWLPKFYTSAVSINFGVLQQHLIAIDVRRRQPTFDGCDSFVSDLIYKQYLNVIARLGTYGHNDKGPHKFHAVPSHVKAE